MSLKHHTIVEVPEGILWAPRDKPVGPDQSLDLPLNKDIKQIALYRVWGCMIPDAADALVVPLDRERVKTWRDMMDVVNEATTRTWEEHRWIMECVDFAARLREFREKPGMWWIEYKVCDFFD
jgi:hypothetical protein